METPLAPSSTKFQKRSVFPNATPAQLMAFHQRPAVLAALTPPPVFIRVHEDKRIAFDDGDIKFTLWMGILPVRWCARHEPGPTPNSFVDVMIEGPLAYWRHEHIFTEVAGGVELLDRITFAHKPGLKGLLTRLMFDGLPLRFLFFYRHLRTRQALAG